MKKLIAGNWKMNGSLAANAALLDALAQGLASAPARAKWLSVFPPLIWRSCRRCVRRKPALRLLMLGAQDVSAHASGAYTGEVSAAMLKDFACRFAIVGHSERRQYHGETDQLVADKAKAALAAGITPIVCVGETLAEREAGHTEEVVKRPARRGDSHQRPLHQRNRRGL
jgi:triosephosphate isomerase